MHADYRHDPFTNASTAASISGELQMIPLSSPYAVRLNEVPLKEAPTSIAVRVRDILGAAIAAADATTITATNGSWFANSDIITIDNEQMQVTNVATNTLTVTRGYGGTTAATHSAGAPIYGPAWAEVAASPAARQYWPDYSTSADNDATWNTGLLLCNSADAGKVLDISYKGTGTLASVNPARSYQAWMSDYGDGSDGHYVSTDGDTIDGLKQYKSFTILPGHTVNVFEKPLWLLCQGPVVIAGTLNGAGSDGASNQPSPTNGTSRGGAATGIRADVTTWKYTQGETQFTMTPDFGVVFAAYGAATGGGATWLGSWWRGMKVAEANATPAAVYQKMMALAGDPGAGSRGKNHATDELSNYRAGQGGSAGSVVIACRRYSNAGTLSVAAGSNGPASGNNYGGGGGGGAAIKIVAPTVRITSTGVLTVAGADGGAGQNASDAGSPAAGWSAIFEMGA